MRNILMSTFKRNDIVRTKAAVQAKDGKLKSYDLPSGACLQLTAPMIDQRCSAQVVDSQTTEVPAGTELELFATDIELLCTNGDMVALIEDLRVTGADEVEYVLPQGTQLLLTALDPGGCCRANILGQRPEGMPQNIEVAPCSIATVSEDEVPNA